MWRTVDLARNRYSLTLRFGPDSWAAGAPSDLVRLIGDDRYQDGRVVALGRRGPSIGARRSSDNAAVVIKVAPGPTRGADRRAFPGAAERRFALDHPALAQAADWGVGPDGRAWVVVGFHPAGSLADREEATPVDRVRAVALDVAGALDALHQAGLLHANLVPANLLANSDGKTVVVDGSSLPGLAPILADGQALVHLPPEVLEGRPWSTAGDVWALGSCLHTLLRGQAPWGDAVGRGPVELLLSMSTEPPARTMRADVPAWLDDLTAACLSIEVDGRPTAGELLDRLRRGPGPTRAPTEFHQAATTTDRPEGRPLGSNYVLLEPVGSGTTGQVWRAERRFDHKAVAVKLMRAELTSSPEAIARFLRERTTLVGLTHPNLVTVLDMVAEGSTLGIVMELVDGRDLRAVLSDRGCLDVIEACRLVAQVGAGVAAMHQGGVVHRDLKPENILVAGSVAKITDFGIARALIGPSVTRTEQLVGTADYLAPELLLGRPLTPAADVYSLGVVFYETVAGRRPFEAEHPVAVMRSHLDAEPERPSGIPDPLWDLVVRMMAKDPEVRPPAEAVSSYASQLAEWLSEPGSAAAPTLPPVPVSPSTPASSPADAARPTPLPQVGPGETSISVRPPLRRLRDGEEEEPEEPAASELADPATRRRRIAALVGLVVLVAAGTGVGLALTRGHTGTKAAEGRDVTSAVEVAANGTVTVSWKPVEATDLELLLITVRAGTSGTPKPVVVSNSAGVYRVTGTPPGLHCFQALAYFTGPPPATLSAPNDTKECFTVP
jgi:serine/threonine protein kinase